MTVDARRPRMALIGFMASGKSLITPRLARRLGWLAVDTDREIEHSAGVSIEEVFEARGEAGFRELEAEIVRGVTERERVVIALGGGAFTRGDTREVVLARCDVVYLRARPETLRERLSTDPTPRPLAADGFPGELFEDRLEAYELAHLVVDTDDASPDEIAQKIVDWRLGRVEHADP